MAITFYFKPTCKFLSNRQKSRSPKKNLNHIINSTTIRSMGNKVGDSHLALSTDLLCRVNKFKTALEEKAGSLGVNTFLHQRGQLCESLRNLKLAGTEVDVAALFVIDSQHFHSSTSVDDLALCQLSHCVCSTTATWILFIIKNIPQDVA